MLLVGTGKSRKKERCQDADMYPLVETELCPCDVFISQPYGNWSDCILPESRREPRRGPRVRGAGQGCGPGRRFRAVACSDAGGRPAAPSRCGSAGKAGAGTCEQWHTTLFHNGFRSFVSDTVHLIK